MRKLLVGAIVLVSAMLGAVTPAAAACSVCVDVDFGTSGYRLAALSGTTGYGDPANSAVAATAVDASGNTVVVGKGDDNANADNADVFVARVTPAGTLDTTFSSDGKYVLDVSAGGQGDVPNDVVTFADGSVLVVGDTLNGGNSGFLLKLTEAGVVDAGFGGGDGIVYTTFGLRAVRVLGGGEIVAVGQSGNYAFDVERFTSTGAVDVTFGGGDGVAAPGGTNMSMNDFAIDAAGAVTVVGTNYWEFAYYAAEVRRTTAAGALDTGFSGDGRLQLKASDAGAARVALANDGSMVVAGYTLNLAAEVDGKVVWKVTNAGVLDTAFSGDGEASFGVVTMYYDGFVDVLLQGDGKVVLLGSVRDGDSVNYGYVWRLASDGTNDGTVGATGEQALKTGFGDEAASIVSTGGDTFAVGGTASAGIDNTGTAIVYHLDDGPADTTTPTAPGSVGDGISPTDDDLAFDPHGFRLFWTAGSDAVGVAGYDWCVSTAPDCSSPVAHGGNMDTDLEWLVGGNWLGYDDGYYYACVRTRDTSYNLSAYTCSDGFELDYDQPTSPASVNDGPGADIDTQGTAAATLNWAAVSDATGYYWCINDAANCTTPNRSGTVGAVTSKTTAAVPALPTGTPLYSCVLGQNVRGYASTYVCSDGFTALNDVTAPTVPAVVLDGDIADLDMINSGGDADITWTTATDVGGTGVVNYDWCINNSSDCTTPSRSGVTWDAATTTATGAAPPLADGTYYSCVRARDGAGNVSAYSCSDSFMVDTAAPVAPGEVRDGAGVDIDVTSSRAAATLNWDAGADMASGIAGYDWCVNNAADCTTPNRSGTVGVASTVTTSATPSLADGTYFSCVRSTDNAGNASGYECSDSFVVQGAVTVGNLRMTKRTRTTISTAWNTVTCLSGAKTFKLRERRGSGSWHWEFAATNRLSWRSTSLRANTSYSYQVYAYCGGVQRGVSAVKTFKTLR